MRSRIFRGVGFAVLWLAMFVVPSAAIIHAGGPRWLALAIGVLGLPVAPLGWHGCAEWRRRKREVKKSTLTVWDRLLLRTLAVALLAVGGTIFIARGATWSALRHHALWFTDWSDPDPIADSPLLRRVPANAEAVIWIRRGPTKALLPTGLSGQLDMVIAIAGDEKIVIMAGEPAMLDALETMAKTSPVKNLVRVDGTPATLRILATPTWRSVTGPAPAALLDLLRRAPGDASIVAAARGGRIEREKLAWGVAWARVGDSVKFGAEAEAVDGPAADTLIEHLHQQAALLSTSPDCGNRAFAKSTDRVLDREGTRIHGSATLSLDAAREIPRCMAGM